MKRAALLLPILFVPAAVFADGTLYVSPDKASYTIGQVFDVRVYADTGGESINAAEGELDFDTAALEVERVSVAGSILDTWATQPSFSNADGIVEFSGWANRKYAGSQGLLVTITFKALRTSASSARLAAGALLAANGRGTNIITNMKSGTYTIQGGASSVTNAQRTQAVLKSNVSIPKTAGSSQQPTSATLSQSNTSTQHAASESERSAIDPGSAYPVSDVHFVGPPDAPSFMEYPRDVAVGDAIIIKGAADPDTPIRVYMQFGELSPDVTRVMTAADGSFTIVPESPAREGVYRVWAIEERGSVESRSSRVITIQAHTKGFSGNAQAAAALLSETFPIVAVLALAGLCFGYLIHRHKIERAYIERREH